jgi:threonine/homoserine/homoserine lactone efflux protein
MDMLLYAGALTVLFLTPGPVWVALVARTLSGGFHAAWPLALGVVVGDVLWPFLAILGVSWIVSVYGGFIVALRWIATLTFLIMGGLIIRHADKTIAADSRLTKSGMWAGFLAGLAVILGNPKAILFYMGMLPGFFDLTALTWADIAVICFLSLVVPLIGNLILAASIGKARALLTSPTAVRRTNLIAGCLLIGVGLIIPFT